MKLLIVEDNLTLAKCTAQLLWRLDRPAQQLEAITIASDLQTALLGLSGHDAVLCDGAFPLSRDSRFAVEKWHVVRREARARGMHFVLYSGSVQALDCARESGTVALAKPAATEEIYAALMDYSHPVIRRGYEKPAWTIDGGTGAGVNHISGP